MQRARLLYVLALFLGALALSRCGSSPTLPSAAGVNLHGVALGANSSASSIGHVRAMSGSSSGSITVTVQENTSITTKVSANGTFELENLPAGMFTLVFSIDGTVIGTVTITSVPSTAEINLVVQITTTTVITVKVEVNGADETDNQGDSKTCAISGGTVGSGIEIEGSISSGSGATFTMAVNGNRSSANVTVNAGGASFSCAGVKGTCDASLIQAGQKVHVSGTLTSCSLTAATVTASEVKFQK
jgi:hypothetical protein